MKKESLAEELMRLLKQLKFSEIRGRDHYDHLNSEVNTFMREIGYTPSLVAQKNEVVYFFECIDKNTMSAERFKQTLQNVATWCSGRWDIDVVFVTRYGNKDTVKEWCESHHLPVEHIWEL